MSQYIRLPAPGVQKFNTFADFPASASNGTLALALDTDILYVFNTTSDTWIVIAGAGTILTVGTIDSVVPSADGAVINLNELIMQSASATLPGLVNNAVQSFSGNKTFTGTIGASNLSGTNTGDVTLTATGSTPNANSASLSGQALTLQPADGTNPGVLTAGAQTIGGAKTFSSTISASNLSGTNTGDVTLTAVGSSPNANAASLSGQVLTLQPADATNPGVITTGAQSLAGVKTFTSSILADGGLDITATGGTDTMSIGVTNADVINIGNAGATVNIQGTTLYENVTTLQVTDPLITINVGGGAGSGATSGMEIEEAAAITGYVETSADRNSWALKAPNTAGIVTITPGVAGFTINQASHDPVTLTAVGAVPNTNAASLSGQALTLQPADGTNPGVLTAGAQTIGGAKTFSSTISASNFSGSSSGTNTGDITLSAFGSSPNANGASLAGQALTLQPADGTNPGGVSTGAQSFAGAKTFLSPISIGSLAGNTGKIDLIGTTSGTITIQPQDAAGTYNFNLPTSAGSSGQPLLSGGGVGSPMTFGTLGVAAGGTGATTLTSHGVVVGNGTGAVNITSAGTAGQVLTSNGASADPTFQAAQAANSSFQIENLGLSVTQSAGDITIALKQADGSTDPSSGASAVKVGFRDATAATGAFSIISQTSSLSLSVTGATTLGAGSGVATYVYVYLINNAGTLLLGASLENYDEGSLVSTSTTGTSNAVLYSSSAVVSKAIRLVGRFLATNTTSSWASPTEVSLKPFQPVLVTAKYGSSNGQTVTSGSIVNFENKSFDTHNAVTTGASWAFTAPISGYYRISSQIFATDALIATQFVEITLRVNTTSIAGGSRSTSTGSGSNFTSDLTTILSLGAGDAVDIVNSSGASRTLLGNNSYNYINIEYLGK